MNKIFLFFLTSYILHPASAQVSINTTNTAANSSSMLDITSTNKGLLIPRMTSAQRSAIVSPARGLMVYDSTANTLWFYDGGSWQEGVTFSNNLWAKNGSDVYNTNVANVGIGTSVPNANALLHVNTAGSTTKGFLVSGTYNGISSIPDLGAGSRMMFYPGKSAFRAGYIDGVQWDNANVGLFSAAMGYSSTASGYTSTAMGNSTASGDYSTAMGYSTASGAGSTAIGYVTTASGNYSTAMGNSATASGDYSTAMGSSTNASGGFSTAMGFSTNAAEALPQLWDILQLQAVFFPLHWVCIQLPEDILLRQWEIIQPQKALHQLL